MLHEWQVNASGWSFPCTHPFTPSTWPDRPQVPFFKSSGWPENRESNPISFRVRAEALCHFGGCDKLGAWSRCRSNFGRLEPELKTFRWWRRSLKFGFRFHSPCLWGKRVCTNDTMDFGFHRSKSFQSRGQKLLNVGAGAGANILDVLRWSQILGPKFEFRLHR